MMDSGLCWCGSGWFALESEEGEPFGVCIDEQGVITGWAGALVCIECDTKWQPPRERLRLIQGETDDRT